MMIEIKNGNYIEIQIVNHCNLNCASCTHYSPLAKEWFITLDDFKSQLMNLKLFYLRANLHLEVLRIMGGEPLLHPQVLEICKVARKIFPEQQISIVTNGILLPNQSKEFFEVVNQEKIQVDLSNYGLKNEDIILHTLYSNCRQYEIWDCKNMYNPSICLDKVKDTYCLTYPCYILRDNYLYQCAVEAYSDILFNYFNIKLEYNPSKLSLLEEDKDKINQFFSTIPDFCSHCSNWRDKMLSIKPQHVSNKKINEWLKEE